MGERFNEAMNWCDRVCERCPLAAGRCKLAEREAQRRWVHEARGEDPDDPAIQDADFDDAIREALVMVTRLALEAGIDPMQPAPEPVVSLSVARLQKLGTAFAVSIGHLVRALPPPLGRSEAARELSIQALVLARKCARLVDSFDELGNPLTGGFVWASDAVPNLLLLDEVDRRLIACMDALLPPGKERESLFGVYAQIRRLIAPLRAAVDDDALAELKAMVERGEAPSPFSIVSPE